MTSAPLPLVDLRHVNVTLDGHHALKDVSWSLSPGEHWAFVGANGSGKSTLLRVIRGQQWIDPDGGERAYGFDGTPRGAMTAAAHIGFVAPEQQERYVRLDLPIDGRSVIASGFDDTLYVHGTLSAERSAAVEAIVERLDIGAFAKKRVRSLSFGQLRRLLIARALVRKPRILVLDEFTNGLDGAARRDILAFLGSLAPDVQLILASHRFDDFVPAITHHATMRGGRIVERDAGRPQAPVRSARTPRAECARAANTGDRGDPARRRVSRRDSRAAFDRLVDPRGRTYGRHRRKRFGEEHVRLGRRGNACAGVRRRGPALRGKRPLRRLAH